MPIPRNLMKNLIGRKTMRKCLTAIILMALMLLGEATIAQAAPKVLLNNSMLSFDVPPIIENGRTLVPLRTIFEALGASVRWDGETQTVIAEKADTEIKLAIGGQAYKNGQPVSLDVPAKIVDGRTLVPLRFVSEAMGCQVMWDDNTNTVTIAASLSQNQPESKQISEISDGLTFFYDGQNSLTFWISKEKLPEAVKNFAYVGACHFDKKGSVDQIVSQYIKDRGADYYGGQKYNTAGFGEIVPERFYENERLIVFLFDSDQNVIGYHEVKKEDLNWNREQFVDIHMAVEINYDGIITATDFKVLKKVNGIIDPDFNWAGGVSSYDITDGVGEVILKYLFFEKGTEYEVKPVDDKKIIIKDMKIMPSDF